MLNYFAEVPEYEQWDAASPGGAAVRAEAAGPGLRLGHEEAGPGQLHSTLQGSTVQYSAVRYSTVQYTSVQ